MKHNLCVQGTWRLPRSRRKARSATGRRGPGRRSGCSARRPCVRRIAGAPPPAASRGKARRSFHPRRAGACRIGCTGRPHCALSGAVCSWRGRSSVWRPGPRRRRASRQPCPPRISRGPPPAFSQGTAHRTNGPPPPGACRTGCKRLRRDARPFPCATAHAHSCGRGRGRGEVFPPPAAGRLSLGWQHFAFRRNRRTPCAPARAAGLRTAGRARRRCALRCACETARGRAACELRDRRRPRPFSLSISGSGWKTPPDREPAPDAIRGPGHAAGVPDLTPGKAGRLDVLRERRSAALAAVVP